MNSNDCYFEKVSQVGVGISLFFIAMGLSIMGGTLSPLIALLIAIPVYFAAGYFFSAPSSPECSIG